MNSVVNFQPEPPLLDGYADPECVACVIVPARNEEGSLATTLDALAAQRDEAGRPLARTYFEVLLLLNNCTDRSARVAHAWQAAHPNLSLHIIEQTLSANRAHVGTARRLLMDTAWRRLAHCLSETTAILSTDSDTLVAPDWIAQNVRALRNGADAVGGVIHLRRGDLESLPAGARTAYVHDRRYQRVVAELEHIFDPQAGDPAPRHLEHFGASLACTPKAYERSGGLPAVDRLEDAAFVDALRRVDAKLRHDPAVVVFTSSRLDGRAEVGLAHQLRLWQQMSEDGVDQCVPSAAWLMHRFRTLGGLRRLSMQLSPPQPGSLKLIAYPPHWHSRILDAHGEHTSVGAFLCTIDCDRLIEETFHGIRVAPILEAISAITSVIREWRFKESSGQSRQLLAAATDSLRPVALRP